MNYPDLGADILEEFASFEPSLSLAGLIVRNPDRQRTQTAAWKAAHPARVRELALRHRRAHGVTAQRGAPSRPFVDQHGTAYRSLTDAAEKCGMHRSCVYAVLRGRRESAKGYVFRYLPAEGQPDGGAKR